MTRQDWEMLARLVLSAIVLTAALVIILSKTNPYPDAHQKWAFGIIGVILGYWLR